MKKVILDTNVGLVAAGAFEADGGKPTMALKTWCTDLLCKIMQNEVGLVIDEDREIVSEYLHKMPGYALGGEFIKWLSCNIWSGGTVSCVGIHKTKGGYVEFPADKELSEFDLSDRKFIAVAVANNGAAPIQEATDGKWWKWSKNLARHGVTVEFGDDGFARDLCCKKNGCDGKCENCHG